MTPFTWPQFALAIGLFAAGFGLGYGRGTEAGIEWAREMLTKVRKEP